MLAKEKNVKSWTITCSDYLKWECIFLRQKS